MDKLTVDARGLSCPQPVLMTMEALKKNAGAYDILVDNQTSVGNVSRYLQNMKKDFTVHEEGDTFTIEVR